MSRRTWLAGLAGLGCAGSSFAASPALAQSFCRDAKDSPPGEPFYATPLGTLNRRVAWGAKLETPGTYDTELIAAIALEEPRFLVIGSGLKFGNLHPFSMSFEGKSAGKPYRTWDECDEIVRLAKSFDIPVRGDCLAWNDWLPDWVKDIARKRPGGWREALQQDYERHFESVFAHVAELERGAGRKLMRWCGLVNEPLDPWASHGASAGWRKGAWLDAFGVAADGVPAYIHRAFELAHRFSGAGDVAFFLNETNCDNDRFGPVVRPAMLSLVDALQRSGAKLDAVGLECHLMPQWMSDRREPDWGPFVGFLKDLAARGVAIYLTELDVNDCSLSDMEERDRQVASYIRSFVSAALQVPAVTMVSNWDLSDKYAWLRENSSPSGVYPSLSRWANCVVEPPCPRPALYDEAMRPKASRRALAEALAGAR